MFCDSCKVDRLISDFINKQNICYKCMYRKKLQEAPQKRTSKDQTCRTCGARVLHKKNEKKRQRTVFCSPECATKGHQIQLNNHWTRRIRSRPTYSKKEGHIWNSSQKSTQAAKRRGKYTAMRRLTEKEAS